MTAINQVDRRILGAMTGSERIRMLLRERGFKTLTRFAHEIGTHTQTVSFCINGEREYPDIRNHLADHLGLTRDEIDALIDGKSLTTSQHANGRTKAAALP